MEESGIDLGFDLAALNAEDLDLSYAELEDALSCLQKSQDLMYYELKSKAVPQSDRTSTSFKTSTPHSRTQLKLELMREQFQEQERIQAQQKQQQHHDQQRHQFHQQQLEQLSEGRTTGDATASAAINLERAVPPQVLQVRTVLENPTRYHVIQKQKSQVRQYLSESFSKYQNGSSDAYQEESETTSHSLPPLVAPAAARVSVAAPAPAPAPAPTSTSAPALNPPANAHGVSPTGTMSPGLSSVATSASECRDKK